MKTLIRADSSSKLGHGHIRRNLVLAKQYDNVSFACLNLKGHIMDEIPYDVFVLEDKEIDTLIELIREEKFEFLIIDHYHITYEDEKKIKEATKIKILSFDDEIKPHYCDILLNVNLYAKSAFYKKLVPPFCELRCGFAYALVREEFYEEAKLKREKKNDFLICIGGSDPKGLSLEIAKTLGDESKILIATTKSNKFLNNLKEFVKSHKNIRLIIDEKNLAKLMNESKKLIISASSLVNEALVLKAKFKIICYAKNQEKLAHYLKAQGKEVEFYD